MGHIFIRVRIRDMDIPKMNIPDKRIEYYVIYNVALRDGTCVAVYGEHEFIVKTCASPPKARPIL